MMNKLVKQKFQVWGGLPVGGYTHPETGQKVGEWCIINPLVSLEEANSGSKYARPRIICVVAGGCSNSQAHMLCDAMNADSKWKVNADEDIRWKTEK